MGNKNGVHKYQDFRDNVAVQDHDDLTKVSIENDGVTETHKNINSSFPNVAISDEDSDWFQLIRDKAKTRFGLSFKLFNTRKSKHRPQRTVHKPRHDTKKPKYRSTVHKWKIANAEKRS